MSSAGSADGIELYIDDELDRRIRIWLREKDKTFTPSPFPLTDEV